MSDWYAAFMATEGMMDPLDGAFLYTAARHALWQTGRRLAIELGVFKGRSTVCIAQACKEMGARLYCYDKWCQPTLIGKSCDSDVRANLAEAGVSDCVDIATMDTAEAGKKWGKGTVGFVFVDADHSKEGVMKDCAAWWPLMATRGLMCFHDVNHKPTGDGIAEYMATQRNARKVATVGVIDAWERI